MDLSYDDVQEILKIIDGSAIEELHLEIGDFKLVVRKRGGVAEATGVRSVGVARPTPAPAQRAAASRDTAPAAVPGAARSQAIGVEVKAPMVGTFYRAPAPGAPPFVEVGSAVAEDATVCIIEVMKLMNSIRAGCRGRVSEICVEDGALVEFGQTLMVIEPLA
ncbi:MAG TPA: acetyl-CoA carboxylase biotin carboxyl carrier protein [Methylomirabilota bacterium]|nr:acetyl-CoA carboxylase biotin carboxyl carrier protein [Methylomirabilota bacterium]